MQRQGQTLPLAFDYIRMCGIYILPYPPANRNAEYMAFHIFYVTNARATARVAPTVRTVSVCL